MQTAAARLEESMAPPSTRVAWMYMGLAFALSWGAWIFAIKLHAGEAWLHLGSAGPALAAMILSRMHQSPSDLRLRRILIFLIALTVCWIILCLQYAWRSRSDLAFTLEPWLIVPSALPAWIISAVFSSDSGVRRLLQRLVHSPNIWSVTAMLILPIIILVPAIAARLLHWPLVLPTAHRSAVASFTAGTTFFLYNLFFPATMEEPGWRGLLLDQLQKRWSPLKASLLVWVAWALWHLPLDYFRPGRFSLIMYLQVRLVFLVPIVFILTWIYNRAGQSIQATAIFHASMNTFPFVLPYFIPGFALLFAFAAYAIVSDRMWKPLNRKKEELRCAEG